MNNDKKHVKIKFSAEFHRLHINKNIKFQTRILWKRHNTKSQTNFVTHEHGYSIFNEVLHLQLNMVFDQAANVYEDKNIEIVAIIMYQGKTKSGGYCKYNIAQVLNNNLAKKLQTLSLTQCPDPNANVQVTFDCEQSQSSLDESMSVLNASSRDLNMSRIDFNDDKLSLQMDRINITINKFNELAKIVKNREKTSAAKIPELLMKVEMIEGEKEQFKNSVAKLEQELKKKEQQYKTQSKDDKKLIAELQRQMQKKNKQMKSKQFIEIDEQKKGEKLINAQKQSKKYRELYEQTLKQLEQLKGGDNLRSSLGFGQMDIDDVHQIANFDSGGDHSQKQKLHSKIESLSTQNTELKSNVASMSYKLAQLFNASYEYGGAKLLDYLQTAIGLTEM